MNRLKLLLLGIGMLFLFSGCATLKETQVMANADTVPLSFFDALQRSDYQRAYGLFAKGLSQRISFEQFNQFMQTLREQWGRVESEETETLPFHQRAGEAEFIPLHTHVHKIRRYTYQVKFETAEINFDLTVVPQDNEGYKIVWFSLWGSNIYLTPKIEEKMGELFGKPDENAQ